MKPQEVWDKAASTMVNVAEAGKDKAVSTMANVAEVGKLDGEGDTMEKVTVKLGLDGKNEGLLSACAPRVWKEGFHYGAGDINGFAQLFFDNLGTTTLLTLLLSFRGNGILNDPDIYGTVLPATAAAFVFIYSIMMPAASSFDAKHGTSGAMCGGDALTNTTQELCNQRSAYVTEIGAAGNLMQGIIAAGIGAGGPIFARFIPESAMVATIAGIAFGFLLMAQLSVAYSDPLPGVVTFFFMVAIYFGGLTTGRSPEALSIAILGTVIYWCNNPPGAGDAVKDSAANVKAWGINPNTGEYFSKIGELNDYWGLLIPIAINNAAQTLVNWRIAVQNGDEFPLREVMVMDGCGSVLGGLLGSPFGATMYIGHTAYKKVGAKSAYSVANGILYFTLSLTGLFALISAIIPSVAVGPLIAFVGIMIIADAYNAVPLRLVPAVTFGLIPSIIEWGLQQSVCSGEVDFDLGKCLGLPEAANPGLTAILSGSLIVSLVLTAIFAFLTDRSYALAAMWTCIAVIFSMFGLMHQDTLGVDFDFDGGPTTPGKFATAYTILVGLLGLLWLIQKYGEKVTGRVLIDSPVETTGFNALTIGDLASLAGGENEASMSGRRGFHLESRRTERDTPMPKFDSVSSMTTNSVPLATQTSAVTTTQADAA